ncbi:Warthog protein 1 [Trichinella pseudospiralis]|uniref:Warthog protein 1 n=2 Tax=Trichinella pseudospiralis TaxID=6337 RepID=A0A0V1G265_TRIPS|nr:Warthog protein 1 [Trichinella pseudospiralis]
MMRSISKLPLGMFSLILCISSCWWSGIVAVQGLTCPDETDAKSFIQPQLVKKSSCQEIMRHECLFIHEARDKCPCLCERLIQSVDITEQTVPAAEGENGRARCFHGDSIVQTEQGPMKMKEALGKSNLRVLARDAEQNLVYSPITSWIHANKDRSTEFVQIVTENSKKLLLTDLHLIYENDCQGGAARSVMAKDLTVGRCIYTIDDEQRQLRESKITSLKREIHAGFYSPITLEGNIVVDDVLASCFSTVGSEGLQKIAFAYIGWLQRALASVLPQQLYEVMMFSTAVGDIKIPSLLVGLLDISKHLVLTLVLIATVASGAAMCPGDAGERTFIQRQLSAKRSCSELTRTDCLFIHEAREKCTCTCDSLIASNVQTEAIAEPAVEMVENGGRARCFHGDDWVLTTNGRMQMKHLLQKKDAQVLTRTENGHLEYSPVMTWIHAQKETKAQFINLETESGHRLSLTPLHMIYQTDCDGKEMVLMAEKVSIGKCIFVKADNDQLVESKVISKSKVVKTGIYSPITTSGSIVVNDVLASCFSTSANEDIQRLLFKYASFVYSLFTCPASLISDSFSHQQQDYVEIPKLLLGALNLQKYLIQ